MPFYALPADADALVDNIVGAQFIGWVPGRPGWVVYRVPAAYNGFLIEHGAEPYEIAGIAETRPAS